jgi:transcription initiation factor TFIIF subunit beta
MENIIFKLFERQPNWALKALVQETDQPEVFFSRLSPNIISSKIYM